MHMTNFQSLDFFCHHQASASPVRTWFLGVWHAPWHLWLDSTLRLKEYNWAPTSQMVVEFLVRHTIALEQHCMAAYFFRQGVGVASPGNSWSVIWKGIWQAKDFCHKGFMVVANSGDDVYIWHCRWIEGRVLKWVFPSLFYHLHITRRKN